MSDAASTQSREVTPPTHTLEKSAQELLKDLRAAAAGPLARQVSSKYLDEHCLLPLGCDAAGAVVVAAGAPLQPAVLDELRRLYGRAVAVVEAPAAEIQAAILAASHPEGEAHLTMESAAAELEILAPTEEVLDDARALANQAPVIKLVNVIVLEALRRRASDIHLESGPQGGGLRVRYRIDGVLHDVSRPPRQYQAAVISRVKVMANLNIAERRLPQDGRIRVRLSDRELDLRVSTLPSLHGESVVLRILDHTAGVRDLSEMGLSEDALHGFGRLIRAPYGILLVTGPTGSGKTTTLYGALQRVSAPGVKIITVEDPIEYQMDGITQLPVNQKVGLSFAAALRSILRHDPDIIMVGEIRDPETGTIAIQAALTGHLVFSTLHTNDAPSGITRLVDMGIEPYLVAATVQGILAQRLVRRICAECAESYQPPPEHLVQAMNAGGDDGTRTPRRKSIAFRRGRGCEACAGTGYRGRTGIFELMIMSDELRERVAAHRPLAEIRALARTQGMVPLQADGWAKVRAGITTVEEILRVTRDEALE